MLLQYSMCIMVSKQKMGCLLSLWSPGTVRALAATMTGLSASIHANSCSQTCAQPQSKQLSQFPFQKRDTQGHATMLNRQDAENNVSNCNMPTAQVRSHVVLV